MESWSSAAIFAQLQALGIDTDAGRFRPQAAAAGGIDALTNGWVAEIREEMDAAFWPDFPLLAVPVLWERLTPDLVCPEIIDQRLHRAVEADEKGVDLPDVDGFPAAIAVAVATTKYIEGFPPTALAERFAEISRHGLHDYENWILDLVRNRGREFPDALARVADVMADCATNRILFRADAAVVMALAGRRREAVERARALVGEFPDDPWARIFAGDVHKELDDPAGARRHFLDARMMAREENDREAASERLQRTSGEPAPAAESGEILQHPPRPGPTRLPEPEATPAIPTRAEGTPLARAKRSAATTRAPAEAAKNIKSVASPRCVEHGRAVNGVGVVKSTGSRGEQVRGCQSGSARFEKRTGPDCPFGRMNRWRRPHVGDRIHGRATGVVMQVIDLLPAAEAITEDVVERWVSAEATKATALRDLDDQLYPDEEDPVRLDRARRLHAAWRLWAEEASALLGASCLMPDRFPPGRTSKNFAKKSP